MSYSRAAQRLLHARRGAVRDHGAHVVEPGAQQDRGERGHQRHHQFGRRRRAEQPGEELAEEGEARDADGQRQQAEQDAQRDPPAQPACHPPKPQIEMHNRPSCDTVAILGVLASIAQTRDFQPLLSYIERR